jgi:hypothetical protein
VRATLLCLAIFAAAWLEFFIFPGHTYLEADTQLTVPMLERIDSPGLLSRDLVATNPSLSLTAYDEVTLLLHQAGRQSFRRALLGQQFVFRMAALTGIFLLARATGLGQLFALIVAAILNLGATLAGPAVFLTDREPLPGAFAFSLVLLAMGLLAHDRPVAAGVAGGAAFLYDPMIALPFWGVSLAAVLFDPKVRRIVRPMLPIFLVFLLLLANLAQLQPGASAESLFTRTPLPLTIFQKTYAPYIFVSSWPKGELYQFAALFVFALWAAARVWAVLNHSSRWLLLGTGLCGILLAMVSYTLIDLNHFAWAARLQPARVLLFTVASSSLLFALAGMRAILRRYPWEAIGWFALLFMLPASQGIFDLLRISNGQKLSQFAITLALAALLTALLIRFASGTARYLALAAPVAACFALAHIPGLMPAQIGYRPSITEIADWADGSTWGSAVFLFPDAGHAGWPGVFRAQSRHALWADWKSAQGVAFSENAAMEWQQRWRQTMQKGFSTERLESFLPLPIDYYVVRRENQLNSTRSVFSNRDFVVYDAQDLRNARKPLH